MAQQLEEKLEEKARDESVRETVELFIASGDLTYTNTFCVVSIKHSRNKDFCIVDKTEVIGGNQNPTRWTKRFRMDYYFEEEQTLKFDVYSETNWGKKSGKLENHKLVGTSSCILGEIFHEPGSIIQKKLMVKGYPIKNKKNKRFAHILVFAGKIKNIQETRNLTVCFAANKLIQADKGSLSDPYFLILRNNSVIYGNRINHLKNTIYPKWAPFHIDTQLLGNNDPHAPLTIEIWDWDKNDKSGDDFLGKFITSMDKLKLKPKGIQLINDIIKNKKKKKNQFGTFDVITYKSSSTFIDYLQGGVDMSLMVALDFTASNKHPSDINSLHCIQDPKSGEPIISSYQHAIRIIGNIVSIYDNDQMYPVWAFGLNVPSQGANALHSFNLNFNNENPEVYGVHGIEQTYINAINATTTSTILLSGPTFFAPILQKAGFIAGEAHKKYLHQMAQINIKTKIQPKYFILLIVTDGVIDDMPQTIETIVKISNTNMPLSVIIIGVGDEDFTKMEILDADDEPLKDLNGTIAQRDIIQFIPFNKIMAQSSNDLSFLAKETLHEIPAQFISYADAWDIEPLSKAKPKYNAGNYDTSDNKDDDDDHELTKQEIDYNIQSDPWLNAPVPPGWIREYTEDGKPYYIDDSSQKTQWDHPAAVAFLKKIKEKQEAEKAQSTEMQANNAFGAFGNDLNWASFD